MPEIRQPHRSLDPREAIGGWKLEGLQQRIGGKAITIRRHIEAAPLREGGRYSRMR
jgi:hypothetical protein